MLSQIRVSVAAFQICDDELSDQQGVRVSHRSGAGLTGGTRAGGIGRGAAKDSPGPCRSAGRSFDVWVRGSRGGPAEEENTMPKYMLIMRGTDESNAALMAGFEELAASTYQYIEDLVKAGVFVAAEGLDDAGQGVVVDFSGETPVVTDGPYGETKELFGGYFLLDVASKQEAVEWAKRIPAVTGSKIEVRRVAGDDEMPQDTAGSVEERARRESNGQI
jgi:hypothetical protein